MAESAVSPQEVHAALYKAAEQFNARQFWDCHETLEPLWLSASEPLKTFLQGLIQIAAGLHHIARGNNKGAVRLLSSGLEKLQAENVAAETVRLRNRDEFITMIKFIKSEVVRLGPGHLGEFSSAYFPQMILK